MYKIKYDKNIKVMLEFFWFEMGKWKNLKKEKKVKFLYFKNKEFYSNSLFHIQWNKIMNFSVSSCASESKWC